MRHLLLAAAQAALLAALAACGSSDPQDFRVIVSNGPVYEVPARDAPPVKPVPQPAGRGTMILEGGGSPLDQASQLTVAFAGTTPVLCLIDAATKGGGDPYHKFDKVGGFRMLTVAITPSNAQQARVIEALEGCTGYYFNGGNPLLLSQALRPNAEDSPAMKVIRKRFEENGAVVAGTAAGSMIVGDLTLCECGPESSVEALTEGRVFEAPGLVFVHGVLIDTQIFSRGLLGRHLYAMADTKEPVGVGIDDTTAVIVPGNGGLWQVIGDGSVALIKRGKGTTPDRLEGFTVSLLNAGDRFDPATGHIVVAPARKRLAMARDPAATPVEAASIFDADAARGLIVALATSPALSATGYDDKSGMMVKLKKKPESAAFGNGASVSVLDLELGISKP